MECFYGDAGAVVGYCVACGRALCRDHAAEAGEQLACMGRHEAQAAAIGKVASIMLNSLWVVIWLLIVVGIVMVLFGVWQAVAYGLADGAFSFICGVALFAFGVVWVAIERRRTLGSRH